MAAGIIKRYVRVRLLSSPLVRRRDYCRCRGGKMFMSISILGSLQIKLN
jgi:hypothetical protein